MDSIFWFSLAVVWFFVAQIPPPTPVADQLLMIGSALFAIVGVLKLSKVL